MDIKKEVQDAASEGVGVFFDGIEAPFELIGWLFKKWYLPTGVIIGWFLAGVKGALVAFVFILAFFIF